VAHRVWPVVLVVWILAFGCGKEQETPSAVPGPPPSPAPQAEVAPRPPASESSAAEAPAAEKPKEVLFSEDFESGEADGWTGVTVVEGGAGDSKFAAQGTVGKNPEYWGLDIVAEPSITVSLDIYLEGPPASMQILTFAKKAQDNFHYEIQNLSPGRWHHIEASLAEFSSWSGATLIGDTIQNINIWVKGPPGSTFRLDNVMLYK